MKIKSRKSFICGIKSFKLSRDEHNFIKNNKPWGIILFQRNIKNIDQVQKLTKSIRNIFKDPLYPILIDEEGGQVSRLKNIIDNSLFSGKFFGDLYKRNQKKLKEVGIDVDKFFQDIEKKEIKEKLKLLTDEAFSKKIFGAPTFFYNNKIYWGQDRLDYVIDDAIK